MTDRAIVRLAEIARDYDQAGKPHYADIIEDAMMRLSQSAVGNWWNGVKQVGQSVGNVASGVGNAVAAPFEAAGAAGSAAWNSGIKNAPQAAGQAFQQGVGQVAQDWNQAAQNASQGAQAVAGPNGTGLPGAIGYDAAQGVQNAAQSYVGGIVDQQTQAKQDAYMNSMVQQALTSHKTNGSGWTVINNAIQYGQLTPANQAKLKQQFQAAAQIAPAQVSGQAPAQTAPGQTPAQASVQARGHA